MTSTDNTTSFLYTYRMDNLDNLFLMLSNAHISPQRYSLTHLFHIITILKRLGCLNTPNCDLRFRFCSKNSIRDKGTKHYSDFYPYAFTWIWSQSSIKASIRTCYAVTEAKADFCTIHYFGLMSDVRQGVIESMVQVNYWEVSFSRQSSAKHLRDPCLLWLSARWDLLTNWPTKLFTVISLFFN